jgi:hypothetical protein
MSFKLSQSQEGMERGHLIAGGEQSMSALCQPITGKEGAVSAVCQPITGGEGAGSGLCQPITGGWRALSAIHRRRESGVSTV